MPYTIHMLPGQHVDLEPTDFRDANNNPSSAELTECVFWAAGGENYLQWQTLQETPFRVRVTAKGNSLGHTEQGFIKCKNSLGEWTTTAEVDFSFESGPTTHFSIAVDGPYNP